MAFKFTPEQDNALDAKGQVLVSAAAGSGKTAVLSQRVVNMLVDEKQKVNVENLLVVTFTRAAAAEMRNRINKKLLEEIKNNPRSAHLRRQQLLLSKANICTMDSFCINLARENFFSLDMSADFRLLDKTMVSQLEEEALYQTINNAFEEMDSDFSALLSMLGKGADYNLPSHIKKINNYLSSKPFPEDYAKKSVDLYENFDFKTSPWVQVINDYALAQISPLLQKSKLVFSNLSDELVPFYADMFIGLNAGLQKIVDNIKDKNWNEISSLLDCLNFDYNSPKKVPEDIKEEYYAVKKFRDDIIKQVKKLNALYKDTEDEILQDVKMVLPGIRALFKIILHYREKLALLKKQKNGYDFSDISHKVLGLLAKNENGKIVYTKMAKELSSRYHEVLVDEYQDTNDLQNTIFKALSDDGRKLFKVGDVKQSIYRFRQANPANFIKDMESFPLYKKDIEQDSCKVLMRGNFRSAKPICDFVNDVFTLLMSYDMGEIEYSDEHELDPQAEYQEIDDRVSVDYLDTKEQDNPASAEGKAIANYIKSIMNRGAVIRDDKTLRQAKYSDFAILLRSRSDEKTTEYVKQLRAAGIPVSLKDADGFLKSREVVVAKAMLETIDNPTNDVSLLSVMMSSLYRFTPDEVAKIRIGSTKKSLYSSLLLAKDNEKVGAFLNDIEQLRRAAAGMSVEALLKEIYNKTSMLLLAGMGENGEQAKANLLLLLDYARGFEETQRRGLSRFLRYLKIVEENKEKMKKAVQLSSSDSVQIMTMHGSKGLQFPVCIIPSLGKQFDFRDIYASVVVDDELGVGLTVYDESGDRNWKTMPAKAISYEVKRKQFSEELRILYVAMTRAQDFLHLVINPENPQKLLQDCHKELKESSVITPDLLLDSMGFFKWLAYVLLLHADSNQLREFANVPTLVPKAQAKAKIQVVSDFPDVEIEGKAEEQEFRVDEKLYEEIRENLDYQYPYNAILNLSAKHSASELAHSEMEEKYAYSKVPEFLNSQSLTGAQKGTAQHTFMQFADFESARENLDKEIEKLKDGGHLDDNQAKSLNKSALEIFLNSDLCDRMIKSNKLLKEHSFLASVPVSYLHKEIGQEYDDEKIIIQGVVDCAFEENGEMVLVDYKTDKVDSEEELVSRYKAQLDVYKIALEQTFGVPVSKSIIYSFHLNKSVEI